jgi:hypothetical protein
MNAMLVGEDKPLTRDSTFRLGSFIMDGCAATFCISVKGLRIRLVTSKRAILAIRTITKEEGFVLS